ncbi:tyrosinase family protein [Hamadaea tsunoensis]|uniref:tyrosinase family protein n=1 Tax=Hamadaea tsunoensis TaxID=53368 RepID=UPI0004126870|nr:tyrosinase family protein [Hamadaea tsunoensis]
MTSAAQSDHYDGNSQEDQVRVRRDVWGLMPGADWDPTVLAYAKAVQVMQARPATDPRSWSYQGAIHSAFVTGPLMNQCQHGTWFFLAWHRMYLYFFERIVRANVDAHGGPADFALPYWNYDQPAPANTLPLAFRTPALPDGSANPLMLAPGGRSAGIAGGAQLRPQDTSSAAAMLTTAFVGRGPLSFGGDVSLPVRFARSAGQLEQQPHNIIHTVVGGPRPRGATDCRIGLMTDPRCAALDPIFWLHHANIDRLWVTWLAQGGGRSDPTDARWLNQRFTFVDEHGALVNLTVADILDTVSQLNYRYDDQTPAAVTAPAPRVMRMAPDEELVAATDQPVTLAGPVTAALVVPGSTRTRVQRLADPISAAYLAVDDIEAAQNPGVVYDLLLNDAYVGTFSLFGIELMNDPDRDHEGVPGLRHTFDVSAIVTTLEADGRWDPDELTVTVVPVAPAPVPGARAAGLEELGLEPITLGRISLFAVESETAA